MLFWFRRKLNKDEIEKLSPKRQTINQSLITLSSGSILLTFTFLQFLEEKKLIFKNCLKWSWICFGTSILFGLLLQVILLNFEASWLDAFHKYKGMSYENFNKLDKKEKIEFLGGVDRSWKLFSFAAFLEIIQFASFFIGIVLIIIFMFYNF